MLDEEIERIKGLLQSESKEDRDFANKLLQLNDVPATTLQEICKSLSNSNWFYLVFNDRIERVRKF